LQYDTGALFVAEAVRELKDFPQLMESVTPEHITAYLNYIFNTCRARDGQGYDDTIKAISSHPRLIAAAVEVVESQIKLAVGRKKPSSLKTVFEYTADHPALADLIEPEHFEEICKLPFGEHEAGYFCSMLGYVGKKGAFMRTVTPAHIQAATKDLMPKIKTAGGIRTFMQYFFSLLNAIKHRPDLINQISLKNIETAVETMDPKWGGGEFTSLVSCIKNEPRLMAGIKETQVSAMAQAVVRGNEENNFKSLIKSFRKYPAFLKILEKAVVDARECFFSPDDHRTAPAFAAPSPLAMQAYHQYSREGM
jgi:hypothetical protein